MMSMHETEWCEPTKLARGSAQSPLTIRDLSIARGNLRLIAIPELQVPRIDVTGDLQPLFAARSLCSDWCAKAVF